MQAKYHYNSFLPKFLEVAGITFGNHIFFHMEEGCVPDRVRNHELIHVAQYREVGFLKFLWIYMWEWVINYWKYRDRYAAYRSIRFEIEAYTFDTDFEYLANREPGDWRDL